MEITAQEYLSWNTRKSVREFINASKKPITKDEFDIFWIMLTSEEKHCYLTMRLE